METSLREVLGKEEAALNRTIVGWKHLFALQSTFTNQVFKSHHSGMETRAISCAEIAPVKSLNRTIVGWKRRWL